MTRSGRRVFARFLDRYYALRPDLVFQRGGPCSERRARADAVERADRGGCDGRRRCLRLHRGWADPRSAVGRRDARTPPETGETHIHAAISLIPEAIAARRVIRLDYTSEDGQTRTTRDVEAMGLLRKVIRG